MVLISPVYFNRNCRWYPWYGRLGYSEVWGSLVNLDQFLNFLCVNTSAIFQLDCSQIFSAYGLISFWRVRACMKVSCESRPRIRSDRPILVKQQPISPISTGRQWARHKAWTESHIICSPPKTENCTNLNFCRHLSRARQYFMHDRIYLQIRGYPSLPIISQS